MTILLDVPNDVIWTLAAVLFTNLAHYFIRQRRRENIEGLKQFIGDIFAAISNSNGYGKIFKEEFDQIQRNREAREKAQSLKKYNGGNK